MPGGSRSLARRNALPERESGRACGDRTCSRFCFEGTRLQPCRKPCKINLRLLAEEESRSPQCAFFAACEVALIQIRKSTALLPQGLNSLLKNSSFDFVLKGRGFKPRRKCHKINPALAAEAAPQNCNATFSANCKALIFIDLCAARLGSAPFQTSVLFS